MALFVTRYALDRTGINPANLVSDEEHPISLSDQSLIVPKFGYFYKESLVIEDAVSGTPLNAGQYICTEFHQSASLKYGKAIFGSILITDDALVNPVKITYQVLGGENTRSAENIIDVYYDRLQPDLAVPWDDLEGKPREYPPKKGHFHNFDEIHDWIRVFRYLDGIRDAIIAGHIPAYNSLMAYIDRIIPFMEQAMYANLNAKLLQLLNEFKAQFTKLYFGLDKVANLGIATNQEGRRAANINFKQSDIAINKYMILSALVTFKEGIYDGLVSKLTTNIGTYDLRYIPPLKQNLFALENGANATYIGMEKARTNNVGYDADIYPEDSRGLTHQTIVKISNGVGHRGGLFNLFNYDVDGMYLGKHDTGSQDQNFFWKKYLIEGVLTGVTDTARRHIQDTGNPHQTNKMQISLDKVENLPVVTKENILNMTSAREYLTMDTVIYFMRAFLQQNAWHVELPEGHRNRFLLDNCQVVFSPCGSCGCSDRSDFQPVPTPPPPSCPAANTKLREFCSTSPDLEPEDGEVIEGGYNLYGVYTDGECGEEVRLLEENSTTCGWAPPANRANFEIRDAHNRLIGMGFGVNDTRDPNATVEIRSASDTLLCYIYPQSGEGYDAAILNQDGSFIGFAVNP